MTILRRLEKCQVYRWTFIAIAVAIYLSVPSFGGGVLSRECI